MFFLCFLTNTQERGNSANLDVFPTDTMNACLFPVQNKGYACLFPSLERESMETRMCKCCVSLCFLKRSKIQNHTDASTWTVAMILSHWRSCTTCISLPSQALIVLKSCVCYDSNRICRKKTAPDVGYPERYRNVAIVHKIKKVPRKKLIKDTTKLQIDQLELYISVLPNLFIT